MLSTCFSAGDRSCATDSSATMCDHPDKFQKRLSVLWCAAKWCRHDPVVQDQWSTLIERTPRENLPKLFTRVFFSTEVPHRLPIFRQLVCKLYRASGDGHGLYSVPAEKTTAAKWDVSYTKARSKLIDPVSSSSLVSIATPVAAAEIKKN